MLFRERSNYLDQGAVSSEGGSIDLRQSIKRTFPIIGVGRGNGLGLRGHWDAFTHVGKILLAEDIETMAEGQKIIEKGTKGYLVDKHPHPLGGSNPYFHRGESKENPHEHTAQGVKAVRLKP